MSYTLRGRLESRLFAALVPLLVAAALAASLGAWWPLELAALMIGVGLTLDGLVYHRLLPYQPGWVALPLGLLELGAIMALARILGVGAPLRPALAFFAGSWLLAQVLGHALYPLARLTYAEDGGELGLAGPAAVGATAAVFAFAGGIAWAAQPPTVQLAAGVHAGPLVLDSPQKLVGEPGAIVRGGIRIVADDVTVRDVTVVGGEHGIDVEDAENVVLDDVTVIGARLDGISARQSSVTIRDCAISRLESEYAQGIDISFSSHLPTSLVERCTILGGQEGIVSHVAHVVVKNNRVQGTTMRGITLTEMSMGSVEDNEVDGALGIGIFCGDYSMCEIEDNRVMNTRADPASRSKSGMGYGIVSHYGSVANVEGNVLVGNQAGMGAFVGARFERE